MNMWIGLGVLLLATLLAATPFGAERIGQSSTSERSATVRLTNRSVAAEAISGGAFAAPLHAERSQLVDANGQAVRLVGVNWFGLETDAFAPHGLWTRSLDDMLTQIAALGF